MRENREIECVCVCLREGEREIKMKKMYIDSEICCTLLTLFLNGITPSFTAPWSQICKHLIKILALAFFSINCLIIDAMKLNTFLSKIYVNMFVHKSVLSHKNVLNLKLNFNALFKYL